MQTHNDYQFHHYTHFHEASYTNDLHECLLGLRKNGPDFWKSWNSKFHTSRKYDQVDGCVDSKTIADRFADHFSKAFSSNSAQRAAELQIQFTELRRKYIGCPLTDDYFFDVELITISDLTLTYRS